MTVRAENADPAAVLRVVVGLALVGAAFGIVVAQQNLIQELPEVMAMTVLPAFAVWLERLFPRRSAVRAPGLLSH